MARRAADRPRSLLILVLAMASLITAALSLGATLVPWTGIDIEVRACADGSTVFATGSPEGDISPYK